MKLCQLVDRVMEKIFKKNFASSGGLGATFNFFLFRIPTVINQKTFGMSFCLFSLLKMCTDMIKQNIAQ